MNLVLVDAHLGVNTLALLLCHQLLDLVDLLVSEQAVRVTERKGCGNGKSLKVARDGNERRVAGVDGVNTHTLGTAKVLVSSQNSISATPAEANCTDLVGTGDHADLLDEALNQGTSDTLAVLEQPRTECCASLCRGGSLLCQGARIALRLLRLDGLEEFNVKRVAFVNVGDVGSEAVGGVLVSQQTSILEFPSEDWLMLVSGLGSEILELGLTVDEEDDSLGLVGFLGRSYIGLKAGNGLDMAFWCAFLDLASQAAR
jgi:hypothetical protein